MPVQQPHLLFSCVELVRVILDFSERDSVVEALTVCKLWSEICLDILWYEVIGIRRLAKALGRVEKKHSKYYYSLQSPPTYKDWNHFEDRYCRRVRIFRFSDDEKISNYSSVLEIFACMRSPSKPLFPGLHTFEWKTIRGTGHGHYALIFMNENVRHCSIGDKFEDESCSELFDHLLTDAFQNRMPYLTILELEFAPDSPMEKLIQPLLQAFQDLREITLPAFCDQSGTLSKLSTLPKLRQLKFFGPPAEEADTVPDAYSLHVKVPIVITRRPGLSPFPALAMICIPAQYSVLSDEFLACVPVLKILRVWTNVIETHESVSAFCSRIAKYCSQLKDLGILFSVEAGYFRFHELKTHPEMDDIVGLAELRPLLQCRMIQYVAIDHPYGFNLSSTDIEYMASHWPKLETVIFNFDPPPGLVVPLPKLTLRALSSFARFCPNIHDIHLVYDIQSTTDIRLTREEFEALPPRFGQVHTLHVGISILTASARDDVAQFLSYLCLPSCQINWGSDWSDENTDSDEHWEFVERSLPALVQANVR